MTIPTVISLRPSPRRALDAYDTPPWQVDALVDHVPAIRGVVWEPCAGDGSLLSRLMERQGGTITGMLTVDADSERQPMIVGDATDPKQWGDWVRAHGSPDWVVTNPVHRGVRDPPARGCPCHSRGRLPLALVLCRAHSATGAVAA